MRKRSEARRPREREPEQPKAEFVVATPNDATNEAMVLASMLADEETADRLLRLVPVDAFYAPEHKQIRIAIEEVRRQRLVLDPAILHRANPDLDVRIVELLKGTRPDVHENIEHLVDTLLWDWRRARASTGPLSAFIEAIQDPREERERLRALARQLAEVFEGDNERGRYLRDPKDVIRQTMTTIHRRVAGEAYYPYGIEGLDKYEDGSIRLRPGASPGTWTLVSALSGSGKSTMMAHLANAQARLKRHVVFGAWEEPAPVVLETLATLRLGWSRSKVLDGDFADGELVMLEDTCHELSKYITFFDNPFQHTNRTNTGRRVTNADHLDVIHNHLAMTKCDVFMADLLHRCFVDDSPSEEKQALLSMLAIIQNTGVHLIAAHQQRAKDIETRIDKRPTREGLIGSGAWLDTPWVVLAPHIPAKWKPGTDDSEFEIYVLKQRNGPWPLGIAFDWVPDTGQISNGRSIEVKASVDSAPATGNFKPLKKSRAARAGFGSRR